MSVVVVDIIRPTAPTIIKATPSLIRYILSSPLAATKYTPVPIRNRYMYTCLRTVCMRTPSLTRRRAFSPAPCRWSSSSLPMSEAGIL